MNNFLDTSNLQYYSWLQTVVIASIIFILFNAVKDLICSKPGMFKKFIAFMCSSCLVVAIFSLFGVNLLEQNIILIHTLGLIMYGIITTIYSDQNKPQQIAKQQNQFEVS